MYSDITGIILSGGKSLRMGTNKSFLRIGDKLIIERIVSLMKSLFDKVIIITNSPEEYKFLELHIYSDIYVGKGPLGGIHSGLVNSKTEKNFVISCDVPLMEKEMIEYIVNYKTDAPIVFCEAAGYHQPLVGLYNKTVSFQIEELFSSIELIDNSLHCFLTKVKVEIIHPQALSFYKDDFFFNVNNPNDYNIICNIGKSFDKLSSKI